MLRVLLATLATVAVVSSALAFDDENVGNPSGLKTKGWSVDLAWSRDYQATKSLTYYKISFKGNTISERGSGWSPSTLGQAWSMPGTASDTDEFRFNLLDGTSTLSSPMYEAYGIKPLEFASSLAGLRGAVQIAGKLSKSQELNVGVGLETKPLALLPRDLGVTNQVRFGLFGMKHSENSNASKDFFTFNYRAYAGIGFNYQRSSNLDKLIKSMQEKFSALTDQELASLTETIKTGDPNEDYINFAIVGMNVDQKNVTTDILRKFLADETVVAKLITLYYAGRIDQPAVTFELTAEGSYAPESFIRRRYNSLWSVSLNWWPNPNNPDSGSFFLTYQNGHARGDTENPITGLLVGCKFKF
ncbi:MAG: hypothetical protein ACKVQS_05930 [Fimbriimonadaceae bacterium]